MEKSELEKYLRETYAMPEHRDVHDFALEMLKTSRANLEYHQRRNGRTWNITSGGHRR